ncbi:hypothetical protein GEMRC1_013799 [Eukaryota sp. GEM-RC1]
MFSSLNLSGQISSSSPRSMCLHFQQSLLTLIHLHLLKRLFNSRQEYNRREPHIQFLNLKHQVSTLFQKVGFVSHHFFQTSFLALTLFFQTNTFPIVPNDFSPLHSFACFFGADVKSIFLHLKDSFKVEEFLSYADAFTRLDLSLEDCNDLELVTRASQYFPRLAHFHVDIRGHRHSVGPSGAMVLANTLKGYNLVTSIYLNGNSIGVEGGRALACVLETNSSIKSIDLSYNGIIDDGVSSLANMIKVNNILKRIELCANAITDAGAISVAAAVKVNTTLADVNLSSNNIGAEGTTALAEALKVIRSVKVFGLGSNSVRTEGAIALAEALKINDVITRINLACNGIRDEGAIALAESLKVNTALRSILLWNNFIREKGTLALKEASKVNCTVDMEGVHIDRD